MMNYNCWYRYITAGTFAVLNRSLWLGWILIFVPAYSQNSGSAIAPDDVHKAKYLTDTAYQRYTDEIEEWLYRQSDVSGNERGVLTLPVVVHIMHLPQDSVPDNSTSNITDARVQGAIDMINQAFRNTGIFAGGPFHSNSGIVSTDIEIELCLAKNDPNGNPTSGITRVATAFSNLKRDELCPGSSSTQDECMKALSFWDSNQYINIWIVNSICKDATNNDCGMEGYSYLAAAHGQSFDGPVIAVPYFNPQRNNISASVHQLGHYLNLMDTYFDPPGKTSCDNANCLLDGDRICDTPPDAGAQLVNCGSGQTLNSCSTDADDNSPNNPFSTDVQDLYENFMDNGSWGCMNMFTPGQKVRIRNSLLGVRTSLLTSQGCYVPYRNVSIKQLISPTLIACGPPFYPKVRLANTGNVEITSLKIHQSIDNSAGKTYFWSGKLAPGDSVDVRLHPETLLPGTHDAVVRLTDVNGAGLDENEWDDRIEQTFAYVSSVEVVNDFPYCRDFESKVVPSDWTTGNYDGIMSFDLHTLTTCSARGNYALRYNTNGMWHNGGVSAGPGGTVDALISPLIDLSGMGSATISFDVAYKAMNPANELTLNVLVSDNCGQNFTPVFSKSHMDLQTAISPFSVNVVAWEPTGCNEWRRETISLNQWVGQQVYISFEAILESFYGQNLYLDNICIDATPGCQAPTSIPDFPGVFVADNSCTDPDGWVHYWKAAQTAPASTNDVLLLSMKSADTAQVLPQPSEVKVVVTEGYGEKAHDLSEAPYVNNPNGWYAMNRYFEISAEKQPSDSVTIRFYYTSKDFNDLNTAITPRSLASHKDMIFYTLSPDQNPDLTDSHSTVQASGYQEYRNTEKNEPGSWHDAAFGRYFSAVIRVDSFGSGGMGTGGEALRTGATYPVAIHLKANQVFEEVELSWFSEVEIQAEKYEVYRAADPGAFKKIGEVKAEGFSLQSTDYSFKDQTPEKGKNQYFLKQTHVHGLEVYSDTVTISFDEAKLVRVYPNPFQDKIQVKFASSANAPVALGLYNGSWQELAKFTWEQKDLFAHEIEIADLLPGIYFYVIFYKGQTFRGKIVRTP
ncbi:MAG: M43 family zinc metalloprotease [Bacteroidia bacterium]|nr:M43 family zinc metalloprotease [Bacteroidia bacterium]